MKIVTLLFVSFVLISNTNGECSKSTKRLTAAKLKEDLLCGYDRTVRPKLNPKNATAVSVRMILKYITYSMHDSKLSVNNWLALIWKDEHLVWSKSDYDNLENIHLSSASIWNPDISIYNSADQSESVNAFSTVDCLIYNTGTVICIAPTKQDAICMPNLVRFPFDTQNCTLRYGSWVHSGEEIDFKLTKPPVTTEDYIPNNEWKLLKVNVTKHGGHFNCCPDNTYPSLNYNFIIERHIGTQVCMIIVPALVTIILTMFTLCLSPEETERIALICCNIIIHFIYMQYLSWQIPDSGPNPPLIMIYSRDSLLLASFTLVLTVIQRSIIKTTIDCPIWLTSIVGIIIDSRPGQILFLSTGGFKGIGKSIGDEEEAIIIENSTKPKNRDWIIFAIVFDKVCFVIYFIIYFCMFIAFVP